MTRLLNITALLLLTGCTSVHTIKLNMTECDPRLRDDCWAVTLDMLDNYDEVKEALHICQQRL